MVCVRCSCAVCHKYRLLLLCLWILWIACMTQAASFSHEDWRETDNNRNVVLFYDSLTLARVEFAADGKTMLSCRLYEFETEEEAKRVIKKSELHVRDTDLQTMLNLLSRCRQLPSSVPLDSNSTQWSAWTLWSGIIPGTKWCGLGDIANHYDELGNQKEVDICCRAHDHCPVKLKAFRSGYGLVNLSFYTKSHCECDRDFHACLKQSKNNVADVIGNMYFNVLKIQCMKEDDGSLVCVQTSKTPSGEGKCVRWQQEGKRTNLKFVDAELEF